MPLIDQTFIRLAVALGIGLLIGIERERKNASEETRATAGVRTFTLTSLAGAVSLLVGTEATFIAFGVLVGLLIAVGYRRTREHDPGMTSEIAQVAVFLLGGLSMREPQIAAALAVTIAILLASRTKLHHWIHNTLTDQEIRDGLLLAAAALIVLPLTPEEAVDPWGVVKPRQLWALAVTVMAINGVGYVAVRVLGPKLGLALAGLFSGFVSSTATIGAMGARAKEQPKLRRGAIAGAAASSVATIIQLAIVIGLVSLPLLRHLALSLVAGGLMAILYAALFTWRSAKDSGEPHGPAGRPFNPKTALIFVAVIGAALVASAVLTEWLGQRGLLLASALAGLGDAHASAISAASLAANEQVGLEMAAIAVLVGVTTNAASKTVVAFSLGDRRYGFELAPGIVLTVGAAWAALFAQRLLA
jgi:uncharacterized membrane protein (DUF4010 family)